MRSALLGLVAISVFAFVGCGTEGTETGKACTQSNLIEQCPVGSNPDFSATATSTCEASGEGSLVTEGASVTGSCEGTGDCLVLCQFVVPCDCGVETLSKDEIVCKTCTGACGDGTCTAGENATDCPQDCGVTCLANNERCNGNGRQICNLAGNWESLDCPDSTVCSESVNPNDATMKVTTCQ